MKILSSLLISIFFISHFGFSQKISGDTDYSGFWAYSQAADDEPFILLIDQQNKWVQLVPKNYSGDYQKLEVTKFFLKTYQSQNIYEAAFKKYAIRFFKKHGDNKLNVAYKKRKVFAREKTATFTKPPIRKVSEGGISIRNRTGSTANIYYMAGNDKKLLIKKLAPGKRYYQPSQIGMEWTAEVRNWPALTAYGTNSFYQSHEITDPYGSEPQISDVDQDNLSRSIWINSSPRANQIQLLIIDGNSEYGHAVKRGNYRSKGEDLGMDRLFVEEDDTYALDFEDQAITFNIARDLNTLEVRAAQTDDQIGTRRIPSSRLVKLNSKNSYGIIEFHNRLHEDVNIYCLINGYHLYFKTLKPNEKITQPSQSNMRWLIENELDYTKMVNTKRGRQTVEIEDQHEHSTTDNSHPTDQGRITPNPDPDTPTTIMIGNSSEYNLRIYAENSRGREEYIKTLQPGEIDIFPTFMGQNWVAKRRDNYRDYKVADYYVQTKKDRVVFKFYGTRASN